MHIHVCGPDGEAKFWIEPRIALAQNHGLNPRQARVVLQLIKERENDIRQAWKAHFRDRSH